MSHDGQRPASGSGPPDASTTDVEPSWIRDEVADIRAPLIVDGVATARDAARLRHEFTTWLALDVPDDPLDDVVLAVYEAIANATEHAYVDHADTAGPVRLAAHRSPEYITVTISDQGGWRPETGDGFGGRGLPVMRMLVRDVHISRGSGGTAVHLRARLPAPGVAQ